MNIWQKLEKREDIDGDTLDQLKAASKKRGRSPAGYSEAVEWLIEEAFSPDGLAAMIRAKLDDIHDTADSFMMVNMLDGDDDDDD